MSLKKFANVCCACAFVLLLAGKTAFAQDELGAARAFFLRGQYVQAVGACTDVIGRNPGNNELLSEANYLTGAGYANLFDFLSAKKNFNAIVQKYKGTSRYEDACLGLGDVELLQENYKEALKAYEAFLASSPSKKRLATLYFRLADIHMRLGEKKEAKKYLDKLDQEFPLSFESRDARRLKSPEDFYTVQVGAFINYGNAEKFVAQLKAKGYDVYSVLCMLEGQKLCRIRIGKFRTEEEAAEMKKKLDSEGYFAKVFPLGPIEKN